VRLVVRAGDLPPQGHDALIAILTDGDVFEASLIELFANTVGNIR